MPEHRARKHHQDRVAETLRDEIGAMIEGELSDPRIDLCHVSEVALNPGGKSARVYVVVDITRRISPSPKRRLSPVLRRPRAIFAAS